MLADPKFKTKQDPVMMELIEFLGTGGPVLPEKIKTGVYLLGNWNFDGYLDGKLTFEECYAELCNAFPSYGVCDSPEQLLAAYDFDADPRKLTISLVKILRSSQPRYGGWRWHKWGPYIGKRQPLREYLHDEPDIEEVFTYHVYDVSRLIDAA